MRLLAPHLRRAGAPAPREFWHHRPAAAEDPDALRGLGASAASRRDGPAMVKSGWRLAVANGVDDPDAFALLSEGFMVWRAQHDYDPALGRRFLEHLLAELAEDPAPVADPEQRSNEALVAAEQIARCWTASRLLEDTVVPVMEQRLYRIIVRTPTSLVEQSSVEWAVRFAAQHGLPTPWGTQPH